MSSAERVLERLLSAADNERNTSSILSEFIKENEQQPTVKVTGSAEVKKKLCELILDKTSDGIWSLKTQENGLKVLRILARESGDTPLTREESLRKVLKLADMVEPESRFKNLEGLSQDEINVIIEAIKCLCNLFLNHKDLAGRSTEIGLLPRLAERLQLHHEKQLPRDVVYYDLRLLFLISACDINQRTIFRDRHNGVSLIVNVISQTIDRPTQEETLDPLGEVGGVKLPCPVSDQDMYMISECLKIVFNQTLNWTPDTEEAAAAMKRLGYLISIILVSIPPQLSSLSLQLITHVAEVIINIPQAAVSSLISLPCQLRATPILMTAYPNLYPKGAEGGVAMEGGVASGIGKVYILNIDRTFKDKNLSPIISLINALHMRLSGEPGPGKHSVSTLLTSLITISRANSIIRTFLKSEVLPPLGTVVQRPDEGDSLKSKIVRLMTAASPFVAAEEVSAEFLFVLCKENVSRLVKYTGYGRAAGLLMSRGLLGGGVSPGQSNYSSDEEDSDTEEYMQSKLDMMTGGPAKDGASALEGMTDEEKEKEARELHDLIQKLNEKGIIQMAPLGSDNQPIKFPPPPPDDDNDSDPD